MNNYSGNEIINIGSGEEVSIGELAELVKPAVEFKGDLTYDKSKPDGTPGKFLDVSKVHDMGWKHKVKLEDGISEAYKDFLKGYEAEK